MDGSRLRTGLRTLVDLGALGTALYFIAGYFPGDVMFAPTTTSGGDMGTHYYAVHFLRHELLPQGRVTGWCPGNYCGFPLFQMYFPLPFFLMALGSFVLDGGLQVAFKLGTVLGTFLLPVCAYLSLRAAAVPFPGPALAAFTPLFFIFMQDNSMWGGNIPSTLAGEFALSLGLSLAVLFIGTLRRTMATGRGAVWNGALVAMIGISHGYTLLWAGWSSLVELATTRGWWKRVGTLVTIHGLAILLMGAWFLPLVLYGQWTTSYNHSWPLRSWKEALPPILWPCVITAVATALLEALLALWQRRPFSRALATIWGATIVAVIFWKISHVFHVVDIRFVPFAQLGLCIAAAAGLGTILARLPLPEIWPVVAAMVVLPWVEQKVTFIPSWIKWNYSGFEQKSTWPILKGLTDHLKGGVGDPRIVYEHAGDHESLGTVRVFENLPLFTGRGTLEGLYMQGSPTAPFVFYIQSEISKEISCPFPVWGCARFDLERGLGHLRMLNVSDWIVRSDRAKTEAAKRPDLALRHTVGPYQIWRLTNADGRYAVPLAWKPTLVRDPFWKEASYRWFKEAGPDDPVPVFAADVAAGEAAAFAADVPVMPKQLVREALPPATPLTERVENDRIVIEHATPGHPILVRISYHPRWKALGGERVWLVGPSFMLVWPKSARVELVYDGGLPVTLGSLFTALGLVILLGSLLPAGRRVGARLIAAAGGLPWIAQVGDWIRDPAVWSAGRRRLALAASLAVIGAGVAWGAMASDSSNAESVYREAQQLYEKGKLKESAVLFHRAQELAPLSATAIHASYFEAIASFREQDYRTALGVFERLVETFPEGINAPEALYHVGLCKLHLQDQGGAIVAWEETVRRFPDAPWAKYAQERLNETRRAG